jgi:diacylglycerol kinase family enzyme
MNQASASSHERVAQLQQPARRVAIVLNPRACAKLPPAWWQRTTAALDSKVEVCAAIETRGDGSNVDRVARLIEEARPETVIAAGGDGTVGEVVQAILQTGVTPAPALAIIPLGTANNVARSIRISSWRQTGEAAIDGAVATVFGGVQRRLDLGEVGGRYFIGSFAIGMDADILRWRNRYQDKIRPQALSGYPLYLCSCAVNVLRVHGGVARLNVDGTASAAIVYNLLITNVPIYAGEFRFDAGEHADDGRLELHVFTGALDYLARYPAAWRRHVRYTRGRPVQPPRQMQRVREVEIEFALPVVSQLDGEELTPASRYRVRVIPQALTVHVPSVVTADQRDV